MALSGALFVITAFAVLEGLAKGALWPWCAAVACFAAGYGSLVLEEMRGERA